MELEVPSTLELEFEEESSAVFQLAPQKSMSKEMTTATKSGHSPEMWAGMSNILMIFKILSSLNLSTPLSLWKLAANSFVSTPLAKDYSWNPTLHLQICSAAFPFTNLRGSCSCSIFALLLCFLLWYARFASAKIYVMMPQEAAETTNFKMAANLGFNYLRVFPVSFHELPHRLHYHRSSGFQCCTHWKIS